MSIGALVKSALSRLDDRVIVRNRRGFDSVALTFDDGPHPQNTPRVLDVLAKHSAVATFFLQGNMVRKHPEIVRAIHAAGHQVANHGYEHISARKVSNAAAVANADKCQDEMQQVLGCALSRDFRPPYGDVRLGSFPAFRRAGYRLVFWSLDSNDSFVGSAEPLVERMNEAAAAAGSIVLMHDDYPHTAEALPQIIQQFRTRQLRFARAQDF